MNFFWWLLIVLWIAYSVFIVRFMREAYHKKILYLRKPDMEISIKYSCAARYDISNVEEIRLYLGLVFLVPIRIISSLPLFFFGMIIASLIAAIYGGTLPFTSHCGELPKTKGPIIHVNTEYFLQVLYEAVFVVHRSDQDQEHQAEDK